MHTRGKDSASLESELLQVLLRERYFTEFFFFFFQMSWLPYLIQSLSQVWAWQSSKTCTPLHKILQCAEVTGNEEMSLQSLGERLWKPARANNIFLVSNLLSPLPKNHIFCCHLAESLPVAQKNPVCNKPTYCVFKWFQITFFILFVAFLPSSSRSFSQIVHKIWEKTF